MLLRKGNFWFAESKMRVKKHAGYVWWSSFTWRGGSREVIIYLGNQSPSLPENGKIQCARGNRSKKFNPFCWVNFCLSVTRICTRFVGFAGYYSWVSEGVFWGEAVLFEEEKYYICMYLILSRVIDIGIFEVVKRGATLGGIDDFKSTERERNSPSYNMYKYGRVNMYVLPHEYKIRKVLAYVFLGWTL